MYSDNRDYQKTSQNDVCQKISSLQANTVEESGQYNDNKNGRDSKYSAVKPILRLTTIGEKYKCIYFTYCPTVNIACRILPRTSEKLVLTYTIYIYIYTQTCRFSVE